MNDDTDVFIVNCSATDCHRPVWDNIDQACILHARHKEKEGFWEALWNEKRKQLQQFGAPPQSPNDLDSIPNNVCSRAISDYRGILFPEGQVPSWALAFPITFLNCEFLGSTTFTGAHWPYNAYFNGVRFLEPMDISHSQLGNKEIVFHDCHFTNALVVNQSHVGRVIFRRSVFWKNVILMNLQINDRLTLQSCTFKANVSLEGIERVGGRPDFVVSFENCQLMDADIDWDSLERTRFRACQWNLRRKSFGEMLQIPAGMSDDGKGEVLRKKEEQYRQLRRMSARDSDAKLTNEFLVLEIEAQRLLLKQRPFMRRTPLYWFLSLYKYVSLYNGSFLRPLMWLCLLAAILPFILLFGGFEIQRQEQAPEFISYEMFSTNSGHGLRQPTAVECVSDWSEAFLFTINSMSIRGSLEWKATSTLSSAAKTTAHLCGPTLILLFIFALRRRFQIPKGLE